MKYLVLGPSGLGAFAIAGCLNHYETHGQTDDLLEIAGSSSGALLAFVWLVMNRDTRRVLDWALDIDSSEVTKLKLTNLLSEFGLIDHLEIRKRLPLDGGDITFGEFYSRTNIKFHVATFCVNRSVTEYFSVENSPQMKVGDALCMSISIPFLFKPYVHRNQLHYVDGGTVEDIPLYPFLNRSSDDIMCICIEYPFDEKYDKILKLKDYLQVFVNSITHHRYQYSDLLLTKNNIAIQLGKDLNTFDFSMDIESKIKLFLKGYHFAEAFTQSGRTK